MLVGSSAKMQFNRAAESRSTAPPLQRRTTTRLIALVGLSLLVAGCGDDHPACMPSLHSGAAQQLPLKPEVQSGPVRLFVDGSGSMLGFITDDPNSSYREAIRFLPSILQRES